ncbi:NO-binding membrane sensor protein with MHYT domain [Nocardia transvalensis]|uniref:NO-binding membrane sensor protein with MHYT domain n=1 Tax=Nocardia transvalensis TaxID=37333 RepID=A0A7W9UIQ3_9NOCA|nr:MHYT domain-containing protein [Nocardia transvalensis]MBB5914629.1 NO-binding membrane sensor protein with MHYT domain [Nocardia transvalensis]
MYYFSMGYWVLGLALGVSLAGAVVGLACVRQSTMSRTAKFRLVWLTAAAVSLGGIGTWLAVFITMLGVGVPVGTIRYDVTSMVLAAVLAVISVLGGLLISGRGTDPARLAGGGVVMGLGLGLMHYLGMNAVGVQGSFEMNLASTAGATAIAVVVSLGVLWVTSRFRAMPILVGAALVFALAIIGLHYLGLAGVRVEVDPAVLQPPGEDLFGLFVPVFALGTLSLAIPITAILVAPDRSRSARPTVEMPSDTAPAPRRTPTPVG